MKYFIQTKNGKKYELTRIWWERWLYNTNGDFVISWSPDENPTYIKRDEIAFGCVVGLTKEQKEELRKGEK